MCAPLLEKMPSVRRDRYSLSEFWRKRTRGVWSERSKDGAQQNSLPGVVRQDIA